MNSETGSARNLVVLADQDDREAWLECRREGLGGSDIVAICDESPYAKAIDVWNAKHLGLNTNEVAVGDKAERLEMGHLLEPVIVDMYARGAWKPAGESHRTVWRPPLVARRERPWQRGSADGLGLDNGRPVSIRDCGAYRELVPPPAEDNPPWWDELVECKTHGYHAGLAYDAAEDGDDDYTVPPDKVIQCSWYTGLWEVPRIRLLALIDTHKRRSWLLPRNPTLEADLLTIGEEWWKRHVIDGLQPDPDGSKRYQRHLRTVFARGGGGIVRASAELERVVTELRAALEEKKASETRIERLKQTIQQAMGNAETLLTSHGNLTWTTQRGRVALRPAIDEIYRAAGWTGERITQHEDKHRGEDARVFRTPQKWSRK